VCPYKGMSNCEPQSLLVWRNTDTEKDYNVVVNGKEHKDLIWWYKYPTAESAPITGHICFYNEKVEVYIDGEKEEQ